MTEFEKYDWLNVARTPGGQLQKKLASAEMEKMQQEIEKFLKRMHQTLSELHYIDPLEDVTTHLFVQTKQELQALEDFFQSLGEKIDMRRSDWLMLLDPAMKEAFLQRTRRLNELREKIARFTQRQPQQAKNASHALLGSSQKSLDKYELQLVMNLEKALKVMNALAVRLNPYFDPRLGS